MALTKIKADGLTADLIDETKLADNSIDSEHYNDGSIDEAHIADDAVTADKLANAINTDIAAKAVLTGSTNNTITTVTGANAIQGESGLTFDGSTMNLTAASGDARLTLIGTEGNDARISLVADDGDDHIDQYNIRSNADDNSLSIDQFESGSFVERVTVANGGKVGIGTAPSDLLHLKFGTNLHMRFNDAVDSVPTISSQQDNGDYNIFGLKINSLRIQTGTSPAERVRIDSDGKVGIGTTSPSSKVQIQTHDNGSGSATRGHHNLLEIKHPNTTTTGDGPALLLNGYYGNAEWAFAKISAANSGSGYGGAFKIYVHPADGTQGSNVVEALDITGDGSGANVKVTNGNLVIGTSGHGIDFSATSHAAGMTSELLDSYEEGTWTPAVTFGGGNTGITYNGETGGSYTKTGRMVYIHGRLRLSDKGSSGGTAKITGLPFAAGNVTSGSSGLEGGAFFTYLNNIMSGHSEHSLLGFIEQGSSTIELTFRNDSGDVQSVSESDWEDGTSIAFEGVYPAA